MSRTFWEHYPELDKRLIELSQELKELTATERENEMARILTEEYSSIVGDKFTADKCRNRLKRVKLEQLQDKPVTVLMPHYEKYKEAIEGTAPEKMANGFTYDEYIENMKQGTHKTLVLSDLHIPLQDEEKIQEAVERNITASLVVLNGDIMDAYALSTFTKSEKIPIYEEIDGVVRFYEWISEVFSDKFIVVTQGNHEARVLRQTTMPQGLEFLADSRILARLARPFPNILVVDDWYVQVGDAIYAHSDAASSIDAKPAVDTAEFFVEHQDELGLNPFKLIVQAHTHRVSVTYRSRYKAMESGCLCRPMAYAMKSTKYKRTQMNGFVSVLQREGKSDISASREFCWPATAEKK